jgi:methylated-DNA-[protein]-cysteine S-methyltransferase
MKEGEEKMSKIYFDRVTSDKWSFYIAATSIGLCFVGSSPENWQELEEWVSLNRPNATLVEDSDALSFYKQQFLEYLNGERQLFTLPVDVQGTTFQKQVWRELQKIPYGKTKTYGEIADALGKATTSARAIGTAVGKNPLLILCPCHRVVPQSGKPRGFRGGLEMKEQLLALEKTRN